MHNFHAGLTLKYIKEHIREKNLTNATFAVHNFHADLNLRDIKEHTQGGVCSAFREQASSSPGPPDTPFSLFSGSEDINMMSGN